MSWTRWMALVGLSLILPGSAIAQPGDDPTSVPRTLWGTPDLQGVWDFRTVTPLERPDELEGKEFLTDEEAAAFEQQLAATRVDRRPPEGSPSVLAFQPGRGTGPGRCRRESPRH